MTKRIIALAISCCCITFLFSQDYQYQVPDSIIYLSPHQVSEYKEIDIIPIWPEDFDVETFTHPQDEWGDNQHEFPNEYGNDRWVKYVDEPAMYVFHAKNTNHPSPAVLIYPGGAGKWVSIDREGFNVARKLVEEGITAIVVKYRTRPEKYWNTQETTPEIMSIYRSMAADVKRSGKVIFNMADQLNIDKSRMGMMGFSAGTWYTILTLYQPPEDIILLDDNIDAIDFKPAFAFLGYGIGEHSIDMIMDSPAVNTPAYLMSAKDDPHIDIKAGKKLYKLLDKKGVKVGATFLEIGGHGFGINPVKPGTNYWLDEFIEWMKTLTPWEVLFNGKSKDGWEIRDGLAEFRAEGGDLVTEQTDSINFPYLIYDKILSDFILECEVRLTGPLNSGILIRGISDPSLNQGKIHGFQMEIDQTERRWTGGIYEEAGRQWLTPLAGMPEAMEAYIPSEWNHYRIEAIADTFKIWVNDVPTTHLVDSKTEKGIIGFQIHKRPQSLEKGEIRIRNIRIITEEPALFSRSIEMAPTVTSE